jgi:hypothetical protein
MSTQISIATRVEEDLAERLKSLSRRTGRSAAQLFRWALEYALPVMERELGGPIPPAISDEQFAKELASSTNESGKVYRHAASS